MRTLACLLALAAAVAAQESEAERLFADAWTAQELGDDLERALAGYEKAAEAEGPAHVRAKALYHAAVVLQRLNRTDEAVKKLERLSREHPGETELLKTARDRLQEWTAVDLRDSFSEWYQRYLYSPEFQGRVVDLVLKLGTANYKDVPGIRRELLTIGPPAVLALNEALKSGNQALRERATHLLILLDEPPSVEHIVDHDEDWSKDEVAWTRLLKADADVKRRLAAVEGDSPIAYALRAIASSDEDVLAFVRSEEGAKLDGRGITRNLLEALMKGADPEVRERTRTLFLDGGTRPYVAETVMQMQGSPAVDVALLAEWARTLQTPRTRNIAAEWLVMRVHMEHTHVSTALELSFETDGTRLSEHAALMIDSLRREADSVPWTAQDIRTVLRVRRLASDRSSVRNDAESLLVMLARQPPLAPVLSQVLLEDLDALDGSLQRFVKMLGRDAAFEAARLWPQWDTAQRLLWLKMAGESFAADHVELLRGTLYRRDTDAKVQAAILKELRENHPGEFLALYDLADPTDAEHVLDVLSAYKGFEWWRPGAGELFVPLLRNSSSDVRARAVGELSRDPQTTVQPDVLRPEAMRLIDDASAPVRSWAVNILAAETSPDATSFLVKALRDEDEAIRTNAAAALGRVGRADVLPALVRLLDDPSPTVRHVALASLQEIEKIVEAKRKWALKEWVETPQEEEEEK